jgi:pantoate--beta-alanine ligase
MYPAGAMTAIHVAKLTEGLCGPHRPGHFDGVATIVAKLFQILPADVAFFGEKDYQQLKVIQRMVRDLNIPMEIVACPTIREPDGLAISSRNVYLADDDRKKAASLSRALFDAAERIAKGERNADAITDEIRRFVLGAAPTASTNITIDYVDIVDAESLEVLTAIDRPARICAAIRIGPTRLIDNVPIDFANDRTSR